MKFLYPYRTVLFLLTALMLIVGIVVPARGQSTPVVTEVQPGQVTNGGESRLAINGSGFGAAAVVRLSGGPALNTVVESDTRLAALLPARTLPGVYDVQVDNGDGGRSTLPQGLVIIGPTSVQPNSVANTAAAELVITGLGFSEGAVVIVDNHGALETTFVSSNLLRAVLPAGLPPGNYTIRVVNPDASSSLLPNALAVTAIPEPTSTPAPTAFVRPVLVVQSYGASSAEITPGQDLDFEMTLANNGQSTATNIVANFVSGDFMPRSTGGVYAVGTLAVGQSSRFWQPLTAIRDLAGQGTGVLEVRVSYTDPNGTAYNETFALTFPIVRQAAPGVAPTPTPTMTPTATPTATPAPRLRPQLLVNSYETDVAQLEPGSRFRLSLNVQNQGNADALRITMILGGGSIAGGTAAGSTPEAGGVNGAGGEFSNFAPVGASNISFLGDLKVGAALAGQMELIVNSSTKPGAYPVVVSFAYNDAAGGSFMDEQVITLLVFSPPAAEMNFYMEPAPLMAGQPGPLPLQLVNMGKSSAVFGTFSVAATGVQFMNNNVFIGALEPGGSYPLDVMVISEQPGTLELTLRVSYTDDFNQPKVLTQTLAIEVMEAPPMEEMPPEGEGGMPPVEPLPAETLGQRIWRFVLGMVGLSSGRTDPALAGMPPLDMPPDMGGGAPPYQQ